MRWGRLYGHVIVIPAVPHGDRSCPVTPMVPQGDRSRPEMRRRSDLGNRPIAPETRHRSGHGNRPVETLPSINDNLRRPRGRRGVSSKGRSAPSTRHPGRVFAALGAQKGVEEVIQHAVSPEKRVPHSVAAPSRSLRGDKFPLRKPFSGFASASSALKSSSNPLCGEFSGLKTSSRGCEESFTSFAEDKNGQRREFSTEKTAAQGFADEKFPLKQGSRRVGRPFFAQRARESDPSEAETKRRHHHFSPP